MAVSKASAAVAEEGSPSKRFWNKSRNDAVFASYSPFVVCLAAGNLDLDVFRRFLAQDLFFQKAIVDAYEVAEECADDDECKDALAQLRTAVLMKQKNHKSVFEEWGVDLTKESTPNPATVKFIEFLKGTAAGKVEGGKVPSKIATPFEKTKIAAYIVGAMTPCMRLYSFLVKELQNFLKKEVGSNHPYKRWIDNFSSTAFESATVNNEEVLDKLSVSLTGEELDVIEKLYSRAMKLEIEFFNAQPVVQQTVVPAADLRNLFEHRLVICSDFDLTCTVIDSSAILAEIAILTAPKTVQDDPDRLSDLKSSADLRKSWNNLSTTYTEEYEQCIETILLTEKVGEFNYDGLSEALKHLSEFEKRVNLRVVESEVLKGLSIEDIKRTGEHMLFQSGCPDLLRKIMKKKELNADMHVLSYCWCGDLIRAAFLACDMEFLQVHSNELSYEDSRTTGKIIGSMESPLDKVHTFQNILRNSNDVGKHFAVYIGDSVSDLLCLLEADIGIVFGSSASLRRVGAHFGVKFLPLFPELVRKQKELASGGEETYRWNRLSGVLYTVNSWAEIHALLLGA